MSSGRPLLIRVVLGLWSVGLLGGVAVLFAWTLMDAGVSLAEVLLVAFLSGGAGVATVLGRRVAAKRGDTRVDVTPRAASESRVAVAALSGGLLVGGAWLLLASVPNGTNWLGLAASAALAATGVAAVVLGPTIAIGRLRGLDGLDEKADARGVQEGRDESGSKQRIVEICSGDRPGSILPAVLWTLAAFIVCVAVAFTWSVGVNPTILGLLGLLAAVSATFALLWPRARDAEWALLFSDEAVTVRGVPGYRLSWSDITSFDLEDRGNSVGTQRVLSMRSARNTNRERTIRVPLGSAPEATERILAEVLLHGSHSTVDVEVPLMYALFHRIVGRNSSAPPGTGVKAPAAYDSAARQVRASGRLEDKGISALTEYFLDHIDTATAQCDAVWRAEPGAWDMALCVALCERAQGDEAEYLTWLSAALEASPPPEVVPVLAYALEGE